MTRDELRGLIGGYATGSLTEAERRMLFEAALEDQDLFDDLAREQALKAALEEPGARQRLLLALAGKPWWKMAWVWAAAAAATVAVVTGVVVTRPGPKLEQVAQVERPAVPEPPPLVPAPAPAGPPAVATGPAVPVKKVAPPAAQDVLTPAPEPPKQAAAAAPQRDVATLKAPEINPPRTLGTPAPQAAPFAPQAFAQAGVNGGTIGGAVGAISGQPPAAGGGGGGGGGRGGGRGIGGVGGARAMAMAPAARAPRFAFDYNVTPEGMLHVAVASNGLLSVQANNGREISTLFMDRAMQAGSSADVALPGDAAWVLVVFSQRSVGSLTSLGTGPLFDPPSGTKSDSNPTPDTVLTARIPLKP